MLPVALLINITSGMRFNVGLAKTKLDRWEESLAELEKKLEKLHQCILDNLKYSAQEIARLKNSYNKTFLVIKAVKKKIGEETGEGLK